MKIRIVFITLNMILTVLFEKIIELPWWSFLLVSIIMGLMFSMKGKVINSFVDGFISGFLNWFITSIFLHYLYDGILLQKVSVMFFLPTPVFMFIIGIVGGVLNGLACFSGYSVFIKEDALDLD